MKLSLGSKGDDVYLLTKNTVRCVPLAITVDDVHAQYHADNDSELNSQALITEIPTQKNNFTINHLCFLYCLSFIHLFIYFLWASKQAGIHNVAKETLPRGQVVMITNWNLTLTWKQNLTVCWTLWREQPAQRNLLKLKWPEQGKLKDLFQQKSFFRSYHLNAVCKRQMSTDGGGFFLACPACTFFFSVEISSCTLIPLFRPRSIHSGSVSRDDCDSKLV